MNMKRARFWRNLLLVSALSSAASLSPHVQAQEGVTRTGSGLDATNPGVAAIPDAEGYVPLSPSPYAPLDAGFNYARPMPPALPPAYNTLRNSRRDTIGPRFDIGTFLNDRLGVDDGEVNFNFLMPFLMGSENEILFIDGRGIATYTGQGAASAGVGYRVYDSMTNCIWGVSGWVDYDDGHARAYKQAGFSFESLGVWTDFRANAYIPFGTDSNVIGQSLVGSPFFAGSGMFINQRTATESAFKGFDAEIGGPLPLLGRYGISGYVGGYWFDSDTDDTAAGPRVRFEANVTDSFRVNVTASKDDVFGTNAWVGFQMTLPDGRARRWFRPTPVEDRMLMTVNRDYRVHTHTRYDVTPTPVMVAPPGPLPPALPEGGSGVPLVVIFVDPDRSTNGDGTFESPYNTLVGFTNTATNTLIVMDGSAASNPVLGNITLFDNQKLLSTEAIAAGGITLTTNLGVISLPPLTGFGDATPVSPILTSPSGGNLVRLSGNNIEVAGITFDGATGNPAIPNATGITGTSLIGFNIHHNTFRNYANGVVLNNATGTGYFQANTLTGLSGVSNDGFSLTNNSPSTLNLFADTFTPAVTATGTTSTLPRTANTISGNDGAGMRITARNRAEINAHIVDNTVSNNGDGIVLDASATRSTIRGSVVNNLIDGNRGEDRNGNGLLDPGEDRDGDGLLTRGNGLVLNANAATLEMASLGEDTNANGVLDASEDVNGNGFLDPNEDANSNGILDAGEDLNGNGQLDLGEDTNGNGVLDGSEDANGNGILDGGYFIFSNTITNNTGDGIRVTSSNNSNVNLILTQNAVGDLLDRSTGNGGRGLSISADSGIVNANIGFLSNEDVNFNGVLDTEDTDGDGILDVGEDANGNGVLDTEDRNGNGTLDLADPLDANTFVANQGGGILVDLSGTAVGNIVALNNDIIGLGGGSLTFSLDGSPVTTPFSFANTSELGMTLTDFRWNLAPANLEFNTSGTGSAVFGAVSPTDTATGLTTVNGAGSPFAVADQATALNLGFSNFTSFNGVLDAGEDLNGNGVLDSGEDLPQQFQFNVGVSGAGGTPTVLAGNNFIGSTVQATFSSGQVLSGSLQAVAGNPAGAEFVVSATGNNAGAGPGVELRASGSAVFNNPAIVGNDIRFHGGAGLLATATEESQINGLLVQDNTIRSNGSAANGGGINLNTINATTASITGSILNNQLDSNMGPGIAVTADTGLINLREIDSNNLTNNSNAMALATLNNGVIQTRVTDNMMDNSTNDGFTALANTGSITLYQFSGNTLTNSGGDGIQLEARNGGTITTDASEDINGNGQLDAGEDVNGNGLLDLGLTNNTLNNNAGNGLFVTGTAGNFNLNRVSDLLITRNVSGTGGIVIDTIDSVFTGQFVSNSIVGDPANNANTGVGFSLTATNGTFNVSIGGPNSGDGNEFDRNGGAGIAILAQNTAVGTFLIENNIITGTVDDNNVNTPFSGQGIYVGTRSQNTLAQATSVLNNATIRNNTIGDETNSQLSNVGGGILVEVNERSTLNGLTIDNNLISNNGPITGVTVVDSNNVINGVTVVRRNDAAIDNAVISNNVITNNTFDGLYLHAFGGFLDSLDFTIQGNTISDNSFNGIRLRTEADALLNTTITANLIENNGFNGIDMTSFEASAADQEVQTGVWTKNMIRGNAAHGIEISTISGNGSLQPLVIGQNGLDPTDGTSLGNVITDNGMGGIEVNGAGDMEINNNFIARNGANPTALGFTDTDGTGGIDINLIGGSGELRVRITNNTIQSNTGDGLEVASTTFQAASMTVLGNLIDNNTGRGIDLLNMGNSIMSARIGDGTALGGNAVTNNGQEGIYIVNTASVTQSQQNSSTVALASDGSLNVAPDMVLDIRGNRVAGNNNVGFVAGGTSSFFSGGGLVLRVGTSNSSTSFTGADDTGDILGNGSGFGIANGVGSNSGEFFAGNGRVNARITDNAFEGNLGDDVHIESFASTVDPPVTGGTWDNTTFNPQNFRADPLARLNLIFNGNTGNSLNVTQLGAFYNNGEGTFKSRTSNLNPPGAFPQNGGATRRRNAQRIATRDTLAPFTGPDGGIFEYAGMGASTFRIESNFDTSGFDTQGLGFITDFNTGDPVFDANGVIFVNSIFGEQPYGWGEVTPGTFTFPDTLFP